MTNFVWWEDNRDVSVYVGSKFKYGEDLYILTQVFGGYTLVNLNTGMSWYGGQREAMSKQEVMELLNREVHGKRWEMSFATVV